MLKPGRHRYLVDLSNAGGMGMPLTRDVALKSGKKNGARVPAEAWRAAPKKITPIPKRLPLDFVPSQRNRRNVQDGGRIRTRIVDSRHAELPIRQIKDLQQTRIIPVGRCTGIAAKS